MTLTPACVRDKNNNFAQEYAKKEQEKLEGKIGQLSKSDLSIIINNYKDAGFFKVIKRDWVSTGIKDYDSLEFFQNNKNSYIPLRAEYKLAKKSFKQLKY